MLIVCGNHSTCDHQVQVIHKLPINTGKIKYYNSYLNPSPFSTSETINAKRKHFLTLTYTWFKTKS